MTSLVVLLFFLGILCDVEGQAASSYDDIGDAESEWINDLLDWRENVAEWKDQVERGCFVNESDTNWTSLFECSDFSGIQCVNQTALSSTKDPFNCTVKFCEDGRYSNMTVLRLINREQSYTYKKLITIYKEDLIQCKERTCPVDTYTTDQATKPATTSFTPTATVSETTTASSAPTTTPKVFIGSTTTPATTAPTITTVLIDATTTPATTTAATPTTTTKVYIDTTATPATTLATTTVPTATTTTTKVMTDTTTTTATAKTAPATTDTTTDKAATTTDSANGTYPVTKHATTATWSPETTERDDATESHHGDQTGGSTATTDGT